MRPSQQLHPWRGAPGRIFWQIALLVLVELSLILSTPLSGLAEAPVSPNQEQQSGPPVYDIQLNLNEYYAGLVPRYEKLEITFRVDTQAANPQLPYDPAPPPGVQPGIGITVDAFFTPDNWQTVYRQPAFYYQVFQEAIKDGSEWLYPTSTFVWKVRFAPNRSGNWQFRLVAQDASGVTETAPQSFQVINSKNKGFIRVSPTDTRYFEFENGAYFPGLGYNMNWKRLSWENPRLDNVASFEAMSKNGIQLVRMWLSQWSIFGAAWNPWHSIVPEQHSQYIPENGIVTEEAYPGSDFSMRIKADYNPCMFVGWMKQRPAVKPNTTYRVRVRYKTVGVAGPRQSGQPYGLVAKVGDWLWGDGKYCNQAGTGRSVTPYQNGSSDGWQMLEGKLKTGKENFLPLFYLSLENATGGAAYIDTVWIEEDLGGGAYGPNILPKPWMAHHQYFSQRDSYAFDQVVKLAEAYGVYLRPVIMEKNDPIFASFNHQGQPIPNDPRCTDNDGGNNPAQCPGSRWTYGSGRNMTKTRWHQQAWWRYLQARWGYSTAIHSWELLNEGDPASEDHFTLADEFGKYMRQFQPNHHMVSTSFWHSFPKDSFWANPAYPNVDYADIHLYHEEDDPAFVDTSRSSYELSLNLGGIGKPVIRGESGFGGPTDKFKPDKNGIWLHNFIWAGINPGGMIESYWYDDQHIYKANGDGTYAFDFRPLYQSFYNFMSGIPLSNGRYQDAAAEVSTPELRVLGQKDTESGRAHLWIQNQNHTWRKVAKGEKVPKVAGTVRLTGFVPGRQYRIEWWDTYRAERWNQLVSVDTLVAADDGSLILQIKGLRSDIAVKIDRWVPAPRPLESGLSTYLPSVIGRE